MEQKEIEQLIRSRMEKLDGEIWHDVEMQKRCNPAFLDFYKQQETANILIWTELKNLLEEIKA